MWSLSFFPLLEKDCRVRRTICGFASTRLATDIVRLYLGVITILFILQSVVKGLVFVIKNRICILFNLMIYMVSWIFRIFIFPTRKPCAWQKYKFVWYLYMRLFTVLKNSCKLPSLIILARGDEKWYFVYIVLGNTVPVAVYWLIFYFNCSTCFVIDGQPIVLRSKIKLFEHCCRHGSN